ncbi:MAG: hypothetical protein H6617_07650 [Bdellovibrionaceae bacterium]|nr:hypothetical protein [Bdellovibrionales bacterium]MCB9254541.1 hypothetical protein [Pseudobdellovibrionaceae bacterium]
MTKRAIFFLSTFPLWGLVLASNYYGPSIPDQVIKKDSTECFIKIKPSIKTSNDECLAIETEEACLIKKPQCKWRASIHKCMGLVYSNCMRTARRHCKDIKFYPFEADFLHTPNPTSKNFTCDDTNPGDNLVRVP